MATKEEVAKNPQGYYTDTAFNGIVDWEINPYTQAITYKWMQFDTEEEYLKYLEGE